jgi:hypothetical protein
MIDADIVLSDARADQSIVSIVIMHGVHGRAQSDRERVSGTLDPSQR